ncbi:MAG: hypothetical protein L6R39_003626 [Caloplaca ligustica]|nr:MAG: hypothetical protein L6R39_003626 [Caloplaca ligustica]
MPIIFTLRLLPDPPTDAENFLRNYVAGLKIKAFDRSVTNPSEDVEIGTAVGPAATPLEVLQVGSNPASLTPSIVQHFQAGPLTPKSVATAIIVVHDDVVTSRRPEFPDAGSLDVRLEITRGSTKIRHDAIEYNIPGRSVQSLSKNPLDYMGFPSHNPDTPEFDNLPTGAYVIIPAPLPSDQGDPGPSISLDPQGAPPEFGALVRAIDSVLSTDHPNPATATSLATLKDPLTALQAAEIAAELTFNRKVSPLPTPRVNLEDLYTGSSSDKEQERVRFEGALTAYYATRNAEAERLKRFVYVASAAVFAERKSSRETKATLTFPIDPAMSTATSASITPVTLISPPGASPYLNPSFVVPAAYYYALGLDFSANQDPEKLYEKALTSSADSISNSLITAVNSGALTKTAQTTISDEVAPKISAVFNQALRRLTALSGSFARKPRYKAVLQGNSNGTVAGDVSELVARWLSQTDADSQLISTFWPAEYGQKDYLEVFLQVISDGKLDLEKAIQNFPLAGLAIGRASDLTKIKDQDWIDFFAANPGLLPDFTKPGNTEDRARAYIQFLRTLSTVNSIPVPPITPVAGTVPSFGSYELDILWKALSLIPGGFSLDNFPDEGTVDSALSSALPNDEIAQAWAKQALMTLSDLYRITKGIGAGPADQFRFSCMEALFSRGFNAIETVLAVSRDQFRDALRGTVAWDSATLVYDAAVELGHRLSAIEESDLRFRPVNPGSLVNCIPPAHLSPLGPVEYLQETLRIVSGGQKLQDAIKSRRGDIGKLTVSEHNLDLQILQIDLVNESLEYLGSNLTAAHGVLYDTEDLRVPSSGDQTEELEEALVVTPQHSTPSVAGTGPQIYDSLKLAFSDPMLPYSQQLDVARSYLGILGSNRFETMRTFRRDTTEWVMDPLHEPPGFQRHLWRYPLRFEIALEYVQLSSEEYERLYSINLKGNEIAELYGHNDTSSFIDHISRLPNFLKSTGLEYCELYELWKTQFETLDVHGPFTELPPCLPGCSENIILSTPCDQNGLSEPPWGRLLIFIRLWRRLQLCSKGRHGVSFQILSDICNVLRLFDPSTHDVNPDFVRQLVSLLVLRDNLSLPWTDTDCTPTESRNEQRTKLVAIWIGPQNAPLEWEWAVTILLSRIQAHAVAKYHCPRRPSGFVKILFENLDPLSRLVGFTDEVPWHLNPSCTLRFSEVLTKIFASDFTVGEILYLFTTQDHLRGDDPYPYTEESESHDDPLNAPEDEVHGLWELRHKLLCARVPEEEARGWSWTRIQAACLDLGFRAASKPAVINALASIGLHFFPTAIESSEYWLHSSKRRFSTPLAQSLTSPGLWDGEYCKAFHYSYNAADPASGELWVQLPLDDRLVIEQLVQSRQLNDAEAEAVRNLYFAPRAALAPFALIFEDFGCALERLIHEQSEEARFQFFQQQFALFYRRCEIIALHLAAQIDALNGWTDGVAKDCNCGCSDKVLNVKTAWQILRNLIADENQALSSWEDDPGKPPQEFISDTFSGSAFAALLGLTGTGLKGKISTGSGQDWPELRGRMDAFSCVRNVWNSPIPTYIPSLQLSASPQQEDLVALRNGYALEDDHASPLGGAQSFVATWTGSLLIEETGGYTFSAGHPEECCDTPAAQLESGQKWLVTLQRGQKTWTILNRCWKDAAHGPGHHSRPLHLSRGVYAIIIKFDQSEPKFINDLDVHQFHTGFQVRYCGPDTNHTSCVLPHHRLFQDSKEDLLGGCTERGENIELWLNKQYYSTFRDIRRTYQRAFKALLFTRRFHLSSHNGPCDKQSELGYLLEHPDRFAGTCYYAAGDHVWKAHSVYLDLNFLPVTDSYYPPDPSRDARVDPSPKRRAALFDCWERLFDYTHLRGLAAKLKRHKKYKHKGIWELFYQAGNEKPSDAHQLVRHLGAEMSLANQVLTFFVSPDQQFEVRASDLLDERWAIRVAKAVLWLADVKTGFYAKEYKTLAPALAASDAPGMEVNGSSGNSMLATLLVKACEEEPKRTEIIRHVHNGLRERGRVALLAYLCGMNRVPLNYTSQRPNDAAFATKPQDLSELLLQDVQVGILQRASRIEDAIQAVQTFVQRARIGLEPQFPVTRAFSELWQCRFSSFKLWQAWKRRSLYRETWIHWDDVRRLETSEGFNFFRSELRKDVNTLASTARKTWWPSSDWPDTVGIPGVTAEQCAVLGKQNGGFDEGLPLMATPDRHGRPTLIAPQNVDEALPSPEPNDPGLPSLAKLQKSAESSADTKTVNSITGRQYSPADVLDGVESPPLWLQAAIRMGVRFVRVTASGLPPGFPYKSRSAVDDRARNEDMECCQCHQPHPPSIDEYYFWLSDGSYFSDGDAVQKAANDVSTSDQTDPTSDWDDPGKLPLLLHWPEQPMLHLFWTRLHRGTLDPPRRSDEGIQLRSENGKLAGFSDIELSFSGRSVDSLFFTAANAGQSGFRYDMPTDSAVVTPQVVPDRPPAPHPLDQYLSAYPYFLYFTEGKASEPLDFHCVALEVARRMKDDCQFEAASLWCRRAFDVLNRDNSWVRRPNRLSAVSDSGRDGNSSSEGPLTPPSSSPNVLLDPIVGAQTHPDEDLTCCPSSPMSDKRSRARAALLEYVDILSQWVDHLIRRNSMESFRQASVIADSMQRLLGPRPTCVEASSDGSTSLYRLEDFKALPAPLNPRLLQLYDQVTDRKAVVHDFLSSCRLPNGKIRQDLAVWGPSTKFGRDEPSAIQAQREICADAIQCCLTRCQPYRFTTVIPKALEWATMVKGLGTSLMMAFEKGDGEYLAALRASHEHHILGLGTEVAQNNFRAADWEYQGVGKALAGAQTRARYFQNLIERSIIALELAYQQGMEASLTNRTAANVEEAIGQGLNMIPDLYIGFPESLTHIPLGTKLGYFFAAAARIQTAVADNNSTNAALSETQAGWLRRAEEWQHQLNVTEIEIEQIKRQQLAAARRRHVALTELNIHQRQVEHSREVTDFLRDRFTKQALYGFLQQETAVLYRQAFRLALQSAVEAQAALWYELGDYSSCHQNNESQLDSGFSETSLWNSLHEGLLAGEKLELQLRALERKYMTSMCREYELTKHISLRQLAPLAFLLLKTGGECEVEVPEWWFDLDYPGHYMRRLKQVSLSLPCVAGPFTGVHCRLQLLSSKVRIKPLLPQAPSCCCATTTKTVSTPPGPGPAPTSKLQAATSMLDQSLEQSDALHHRARQFSSAHGKEQCIRCKQLPQDPSVLQTYHTSSSHMAVATSTGNIDPGLFDANMEQARYLPFEYAGAASTWRISLPAQNNAFSFDTLSDAVMHVTYTAREGGQELRNAAEKAVCGRTLGDGVRFLDVKHDMAETFHAAFVQPLPRHQHMYSSPPTNHNSFKVRQDRHGYHDECTNEDRALDLALTKNMFPYAHGGRYRDVWVTKIHVFMQIMEDDLHSECGGADGDQCQCRGKSENISTASSHSNHFDVTYLPPSTASPHGHPHGSSKKSSSKHNPSLPKRSRSKGRHHHHRVRKTSHFNDADSSSCSSAASSDNDESDCNSSGEENCPEDLRVKFPMVSTAPPHASSASARDACMPALYYGILEPKRRLGPVMDDRDRSRVPQEDIGKLVFAAEAFEGKEIEGLFLLVEYEVGGCRVGGRRR